MRNVSGRLAVGCVAAAVMALTAGSARAAAVQHQLVTMADGGVAANERAAQDSISLSADGRLVAFVLLVLLPRFRRRQRRSRRVRPRHLDRPDGSVSVGAGGQANGASSQTPASVRTDALSCLRPWRRTWSRPTRTAPPTCSCATRSRPDRSRQRLGLRRAGQRSKRRGTLRHQCGRRRGELLVGRLEPGRGRHQPHPRRVRGGARDRRGGSGERGRRRQPGGGRRQRRLGDIGGRPLRGIRQYAAPDLVTDDTNLAADVFVHDRQTGSTVRASVSAAGGQAANSSSLRPGGLSADGRVVAFETSAPLSPATPAAAAFLPARPVRPRPPNGSA